MISFNYELRHEKTELLPSENKGTDQLRTNCEADQRLCFCSTGSTFPLPQKSIISRF